MENINKQVLFQDLGKEAKMVKRRKQNLRHNVSGVTTSQYNEKERCGAKTLGGGIRYEAHLMIYRWLGQRWDCKGEEPAVSIFIHNFLQDTEQPCY